MPRKFDNEWILEDFDDHPTFRTKKMFGGLAVYLFERQVFVLVEPTKSGRWDWHGVLVCTDFVNQESLINEFPALKPHEVLKKWLFIDSSHEDFEKIMKKIAGRVLENDMRIGIFPKIKSVGGKKQGALDEVRKDLKKVASKEIAKKNKYFFKTNRGDYGYGDIFIGVRSPDIRRLAKENIDLSFQDIKRLIRSKIHEERLLGLIILVNRYSACKKEECKEKIFQLYISNFKYINNWDLVDVTCPHIVGKHLMDKNRKILSTWAKSDHLWTRRIAIITNWWFIRNGDLGEVFKISKILLNDDHDLIRKAVGWMLREAGKKDLAKTETYLKKYYNQMPRTMLRYAIEKFPEPKRQRYLKGKIK